MSLLVMSAFMRAACQQRLEEETDVRVVKQVPEAGYCRVDGEKIYIDPVGNDCQPVADEPDIAWARK